MREQGETVAYFYTYFTVLSSTRNTVAMVVLFRNESDSPCYAVPKLSAPGKWKLIIVGVSLFNVSQPI